MCVCVHCGFTVLHCDVSLLHCGVTVLHCDVSVLHSGVTVLHCGDTRLHCFVKVIHCGITMLHHRVTMLLCGVTVLQCGVTCSTVVERFYTVLSQCLTVVSLDQLCFQNAPLWCHSSNSGVTVLTVESQCSTVV